VCVVLATSTAVVGQDHRAGQDKPPQNVAAAVAQLRQTWLDPKTQDWILRNPEDEVVTTLHLPFGTGVRNAFGLWGTNKPLLASCGTEQAEECSSVIFSALWRQIRASADSKEVAKLDCQFALVDSLQVRYKGFHKLRTGELVNDLQRQIDAQLPEVVKRLPGGCAPQFILRVVGNPKLTCFVRAETSEDGRDPMSLSWFFAWFGWRNAIEVSHRPPALELTFQQECVWPEIPKHFAPEKEQ
jgi:hypothetical protein